MTTKATYNFPPSWFEKAVQGQKGWSESCASIPYELLKLIVESPSSMIYFELTTDGGNKIYAWKVLDEDGQTIRLDFILNPED